MRYNDTCKELGKMKLDHTRGAVPLYLQLHRILKECIENSTYVYGDLLPSEQEMEKLYHVSRITVRQAIAELEKEGYIKRSRGKGTTVTYTKRIDESLSEIRSFTSEMEERGLRPGTSFIEIKKVHADEDIAFHLDIEIDCEVYRLYRVRTADDEPIVFFETYLTNDYKYPLDKRAYKNSMYDVFEKVGVKTPHKVQEKYQAILADQNIAKLLQVKVGSAIFKRSRTSYNVDNKAIEYTISYYRGDRYSYSIQLGNK